MDRIALVLDHKENRRLLEQWLGSKYQILSDEVGLLADRFDLGIADGPALDRLWQQVQTARGAARPLLLPFLLVTSRKDVRMVTRHLWRTIDDLILTPIEKVELQARVEILLRARRLSMESEARYHALADASPAGVFVEQDERLVYANPGLLLMVNRQWSQLAGGRFVDLIWPEDRPIFVDALRKAKSYASTVGEIRTWDGRSVRLHMRLIDYMGAQAILGIAVDITDQVHIQQQLRQTNSQMQAILDAVPHGLVVLDSDLRVLQANPAGSKVLQELAGVAPGQVLTDLGGRTLSDLLAGISQDRSWQEVKTKDRILEVTARPVGPGTGERQWILVISDVTKARQDQQLLQQQQRLALIGQLAAGIAHDFGNVMATVILYAKMLEEAAGLTDWDKSKASVIGEQALHATRLIQQILDLTRQSVLQQRPLDLAVILGDQVELLRRTLPEDIEVVLEYDGGQYVVNADPTRIQQVVMNLALNARDAMPNGGRFNIALERVAECPGEGQEAGGWVKITFADTGHGMSGDVLEHIFEPFFTTKQPGEGSGLGLAQVHGIVGQHGGKITVESQLGRGTTVSVYLPCVEAAPEGPSAAPLGPIPLGKGQLILVVEDEPHVRTALADALQSMNYRVLQAADGGQALAAMAEHGDRIALVLADMVMPVMGGVALLDQLRQRGHGTPVVLLTGHARAGQIEQAKRLGATAVMAKPASLEAIAQAIASALRQ